MSKICQSSIGAKAWGEPWLFLVVQIAGNVSELALFQSVILVDVNSEQSKERIGFNGG